MLVASATAIGGGTVRDILLGHYPLGWVKNPEFLAITCIAGVLTTGIYKWVIKLKGLFIRLDALGLIVFSIIGTKIAMGMGHHAMICMVSALVTGVFGGLLRDLICRQQPLVLHDELYASVTLVASGLYLAMLELGVNDVTSTIVTLVVGYTLRMAAVRFKWRLPSFHLETENSLH
ncbi:trimeric intracellular cation channel family protein [Vibrio fluvialis]|nr:trimeric intracellular cation channel family protein [Vibrio fluvialis]